MKDKPFYGSEKELFTCMVFNYVQLEERFIQQLSFRFWLLGLQPVSWRASLNKACWQVPIHPVCSYSNMALTNLTPNVFFFFFFQTTQLLQAIELGVFKKEINKVTAEHDEHGSSHADILVHAMYIAPRTKKCHRCLSSATQL